MLLKNDGTTTKTIEERRERWTEWIKECFHTAPENETPEIMHISEEMWGKIIKTKTKKMKYKRNYNI